MHYISLIFSGVCSLKASNIFVKGYCNICHRILVMQINNIFLCTCSDIGAGFCCGRPLGSWSSLSEVRFFTIIIFEIFEKYFVLFDIWWWHLCRRCFLKYLEQIFQLTLISVEGRVRASNDDVGIWWLGYKQRSFQCLLLDGEKTQIPMLAFGWRKIWCGIWKVVLFCKCKLKSFSIFILLCKMMKPYSYWHSFPSLGCESVGFGCGRDVRHQATHHLQ